MTANFGHFVATRKGYGLQRVDQMQLSGEGNDLCLLFFENEICISKILVLEDC